MYISSEFNSICVNDQTLWLKPNTGPAAITAKAHQNPERVFVFSI